MSMTRLTADARREQILNVAIDVFGRAGYHGASMNDVATAAGVTKPVLYQHFDSKHDLYQALLEEVGARMLTAITGGQRAATSGRELTEQGFAAYFHWVAEHTDEFAVLFGGSGRTITEFGGHLNRISNQVADAIAPLIDVDIDPEMRRTLAHSLMGMAESASRHLVAGGHSFDPDEVARAISTLAWAGLRAADRSTG